ncbi:MAG: CapA family protein [Clostridia bacterium]|nr:CapA family protein [Clostridia bacterium]
MNNQTYYPIKSKTPIFLTIFLILLCILIVIFFAFRKNFTKTTEVAQINLNTQLEQTENLNKENTQKEEQKKDVSFTLTALGDVLCHNTQFWDAYNRSTGEYDFSYVFQDIKQYTEKSDVTIANLETSFAGVDKGYSNYPTFNSPDSLVTALKNIGIDIITTAGNHCLDMGFSGLSRTIDVLNQNEIEHLGTYQSEEEQNKLFLKNINGAKVAFINYTYGTNGIPIPSGKDFCVNLIDKDLIEKHIEQAKLEKADIIIACMHWGTEYRTTANEEQKELSDFLFQTGVDIIIGNHPHVIEPFETREVIMPNGSVKQCFVAYALGNFTADQNAINTRDSIILNLKITKKADESVSIDTIDYIPIYMYKNPSLSIQKFKLIDLKKSIADYENGTNSSITSTQYNLFKKELSQIQKILGE